MTRRLLLCACLLLPPACRRTEEAPRHAVPLAANGELRLTITTFNIRYEEPKETDWRGWPNRIQRMVAAIRKMDPDIMGMQEVLHGQAADLRASLPDYEFEGVGRDDGKRNGEYSAIFYRRDRFEKTGGGTFWLSDHPAVPGSIDWGNSLTRTATWLHLTDRQSGRGFYVFNTHWDHKNEESRERAAKLMVARINAREHLDEPVVLTGDFNSRAGMPGIDYLTGKTVTIDDRRLPAWEHPLIDTYQALHPDEKNRRTLHFWTGDFDGDLKVDFVMVSQGAKIEAADILRAKTREMQPSDHYPVWAKVVWK
ncbi:MAG: hypothetical protein JWO82_2861 [Akkermansiaceae bacterium]|nr:hypothetical protein [Akkermansiaceae bacterium]